MLPFGRSPFKDMPRSNCTLSAARRGVNRRSNFTGIGIFRMPSRKIKFYIEWKKDLLHIIKTVFKLMTTKNK